MYKIKDCNGEEVKRAFYPAELQQIIKTTTFMKLTKYCKNEVRIKTSNILFTGKAIQIL